MWKLQVSYVSEIWRKRGQMFSVTIFKEKIILKKWGLWFVKKSHCRSDQITAQSTSKGLCASVVAYCLDLHYKYVHHLSQKYIFCHAVWDHIMLPCWLNSILLCLYRKTKPWHVLCSCLKCVARGNAIASKVDAVVLKGRCRRLQDAPMSFRF